MTRPTFTSSLLGLAALVSLPGAPAAPKKAVILGIVADTNKKPIVEAEVIAMKSKISTITDRRGVFLLLDLPPGDEVFWVRMIGYRPESFEATLLAGDTLRIGVIMAPAPVFLPEISVTAEGVVYRGKLAQFADNMLHSGAPRSAFLTREDIEKQHPRPFLDMLTRTGMKMYYDRRGRETLMCPRGMTMSGLPKTAYYLDGAHVSDSMNSMIWRMDPSMIEAVEVYKSAAERPSQYAATGSDCSVVVWTR